MLEQVRRRLQGLAGQLSRPQRHEEETIPFPQSTESMQLACSIIRQALTQLGDALEGSGTTVIVTSEFPGVNEFHLAFSLMQLSPQSGLEIVNQYNDEAGCPCFFFVKR